MIEKIKKGILGYIIGIPMVILQSCSIIGGLYNGSFPLPLSFANLSIFFYDLIAWISYSFIGILGLFFIWLGWLAGFKKPKNAIKEKHTEKSINESVGISQPPSLPTDTVVPKDSKQRYCKLCGGAIDCSTKKCSKCGKQYFRFPIKTFSVLVSILLVISLVCLSVSIFMLNECQLEVFILNNKIAELNNTISSQSATIAANGTKIEQLQNQIKAKTKMYNNLLLEALELRQEISFFDRKIAFVYNGDNTYHTHDCVIFTVKAQTYWAYNVEAAKSRGYTACDFCH